MTVPSVSALITNYNYARFLGTAIESVLRQTYSDVEIVVVDDGSTDNSLEVLESYANAITVVRQPNSGQAAAINAGFAASSGEILCLLDGDDSFVPEKVAKIVRSFSESPEASWIFHGLTYVQSTTGEVEQVDQPECTQQCDFRRGALRGRLPYVHSSTSGLCFRRSLFEKLTPVPTEIRIVADNYLKFAAMALAEGILVREPLGILRLHGSNAYTLRRDQVVLKAEMKFLTARSLRQRWPFLNSLANRIVADGISDCWLRKGKTENQDPDPVDYLRGLSLRERILVYAIALRITASRLLHRTPEEGRQ